MPKNSAASFVEAHIEFWKRYALVELSIRAVAGSSEYHSLQNRHKYNIFKGLKFLCKNMHRDIGFWGVVTGQAFFSL
jgi:hypothetical protein